MIVTLCNFQGKKAHVKGSSNNADCAKCGSHAWSSSHMGEEDALIMLGHSPFLTVFVWIWSCWLHAENLKFFVVVGSTIDIDSQSQNVGVIGYLLANVKLASYVQKGQTLLPVCFMTAYLRTLGLVELDRMLKGLLCCTELHPKVTLVCWLQNRAW